MASKSRTAQKPAQPSRLATKPAKAARAGKTAKAAPRPAGAKKPVKGAPKAPKAKTATTAPGKAGKGGRAGAPSARMPKRPVPGTLPGHRATKEEHLRHLSAAEHAHQDPRWEQAKPDDKYAKPHVDPRLDQGAIKNRRIPRLDSVSNWFRQAAKPKQK